MELPPIIIKLSGLRDTLQDEPVLDLYLGESRFVADKIASTVANLDFPAFYVEEDGPSFDLAVEILQRYPRESYFLMTSITQPDRALEITSSPLGYYDLILFRPDHLVQIQHPETFILSLHHAWNTMIRFLENSITREIGIENFYDNQYLALVNLASRAGLPLPRINALAIPQEQILDLMFSFGTQVIAKLPIELSDEATISSLQQEGVSSFLLDDLPSSSQASVEGYSRDFFDLFAQASYYQNETWNDSGEMDDFSSPEEEI